MKSGNYDELMDKFYAGTANAEEISLLKTEGLITEQEEVYANALAEERTETINWNFEDFLKEVPAAKVISIAPRKFPLQRLLAAAAVVGALIMVVIFWPKQQQDNSLANAPVINNSIDTNKEVAQIAAPAPIKEITAPAQTTVKNNIKKSNTDFATKNKVDHPTKKMISPTSDKNEVKKGDFTEYLVMVNGKPITNEEDAVAITRQSLSAFSQNLSATVEEMRPIGQIKIKL